MSTHEALVIRIEEVLPHPDPETTRLGIVKVWDYQCVVAKDSWKAGDFAVYLEPDTMVKLSRPEFSFLKKEGSSKEVERIKARRLRGIWSEGLLVPSPLGLNEGDDAWAILELERYVPVANSKKGRGFSSIFKSSLFETGPDKFRTPFSKYDLENFKKWGNVFTSNEEVIISEKLHGSNFKVCFDIESDRMYCGSRSGWRKNEELDLYWNCLKQNPWIEEFCRANPNYLLFGEVFGRVQDLHYGSAENQLLFRAFDIWDIQERKFVDANTFNEILDNDKVAPIVYRGPYSKEIVLEHTDGNSLIPGANHIREGVVVRPLIERNDARLGRVILKSVSNFYLERS